MGPCACLSAKSARPFTAKKYPVLIPPMSPRQLVQTMDRLKARVGETAHRFAQASRADSISLVAEGIATGGVLVTVVHRVDRVEVLSVKTDSYEKELLQLDEAGKIRLSQADISEKKELMKVARETLLKRKLFSKSCADKHDN